MTETPRSSDCVVHLIDERASSSADETGRFKKSLSEYISAFNRTDSVRVFSGGFPEDLQEVDGSQVIICWRPDTGVLPKESGRLAGLCGEDALVAGDRFHPQSVTNFSKKQKFRKLCFYIRKKFSRFKPEKEPAVAAARLDVWKRMGFKLSAEWQANALKENIRVIRTGIMWAQRYADDTIKK